MLHSVQHTFFFFFFLYYSIFNFFTGMARPTAVQQKQRQRRPRRRRRGWWWLSQSRLQKHSESAAMTLLVTYLVILGGVQGRGWRWHTTSPAVTKKLRSLTLKAPLPTPERDQCLDFFPEESTGAGENKVASSREKSCLHARA